MSNDEQLKNNRRRNYEGAPSAVRLNASPCTSVDLRRHNKSSMALYQLKVDVGVLNTVKSYFIWWTAVYLEKRLGFWVAWWLVITKYDKTWGKHGVLPIPVRQNQCILRSKSYFLVFKVSHFLFFCFCRVRSEVGQLYCNLVVSLMLACSFPFWGSFFWLIKLNLR